MNKLIRISLISLGVVKGLELVTGKNILSLPKPTPTVIVDVLEDEIIYDVVEDEQVNGLGIIDSSGRQVKDGSSYSHLIAAPNHKETLLLSGTTIVGDTVPEMQKTIRKYHYQVKDLANRLKGATKEETLRNIWQFVYDYVGYKLDKEGVEQLRTPARLWSDAQNGSGGDCDCLTIFTGSILKNLGIPFVIRIADYGSGWQHVYPVAKIAGSEIPMDTVIHRYNYEKTYQRKKDFHG